MDSIWFPIRLSLKVCLYLVPFVKNKCGDLTDVNNHRAIALCNIDTKVLENIVLAEVTTYHACDDHQFGFKKNHSTTLCTAAVKQTIDYYARRGSHVFVCFIDYSKAFDKVNYWKLFGQLLDDSVNSYIVLLLAYWYSHQQASVIWMNTRSSAFTVGNGTKQGGILSPCSRDIYGCCCTKLEIVFQRYQRRPERRIWVI